MGDIVKFRKVPKQKPTLKPRPRRQARTRRGFERFGGFALALAVVGGIGIYQSFFDVPVGEMAQTSSLVAQAAQAAQIIETSEPSRQISETFRKCGSSRGTCVVDGDTLWINGTKIRVADIDTPEISQPRCAREKALGHKATTRLIELVNAGPFEVHAFGDRDEDRYGRKLRVIVRNGRSIGDILVSEGLARTWTGRREPWC